MTEIVDEKSFNAELARLDVAGNGSKRLGYLAKLVRRLTWRIFRPYHAHNLRLVVALQERNRRLEDALTKMQAATDGLQWQLNHLKTNQTHTQGISDGLQWQIDHLKIAQELGQTSADGLQWQINEINGRFHGVNAHLDETRGLYGHLADEMPKFVAPLLDFKRELAEADNRARQASEDADAVRQELRVLGLRVSGLEDGVDEAVSTDFKPDIASLHARIDGVNAFLDETRGLYNQLGDDLQLTRQEGQIAAQRLSALEEPDTTGIEELNFRIDGVNAFLDETRQIITAIAAERPLREEFDALRAEVTTPALSLQSKFAELDAVTQRIGDLETVISPNGNSDRIPLSQRLLEMSDKISDVEAKVRDIGQQTENRNTDHNTSMLALTQIDELKSRLVELASSLAHIRAENEDVSSQIQAVGETSRTATILAETASEAARSANNGNLFMSNTDDGIFLFQSGDLIAKVVAETGRWDSHIVALMDDLIGTRAGVAVDVGAHVGTMTMAMARRFKEVHSFEPNDFTFKILSANVALNNVKNVNLHNYPLFSKALKMSLAVEEMQEGPVPFDKHGHYLRQETVNLGGLSFAEKGMDVFTHTARTLDSLKLTDVDFLKIDAQGADGEVLLGALETINACRPVVVFEWEEHLAKNYSCDLDKVRANLARIGYSLQTLFRHNDKQSDYVAYSLK